MKTFIPLSLALAVCVACSPAGQENPASQAAVTSKPASGHSDVAGTIASLPTPVQGKGAIASAADEGVLARYPEVAGEQHGAYTWHRAEISEMHAIRAAASGTLEFTTPDGQRLRFAHDAHTLHGNGDWTWSGELIGDATGHQAVLTFGPDAVFGNITMPGGGELMVTTRGGKVWVVETDAALAARQTDRPRGVDFRIPPELTEADASVRGLVQHQSLGIQAVGEPLVDVVIGYTNGMVTLYGSHSAVATRISHLISLTNVAYSNSEIDGRIRLVHAMHVGYSDTSSNTTALEQLTGSDGGELGNVNIPASLQPLHTAREEYGGDLVVLLRRFNNPNHDGCGVAWLLGGGKSTLNSAYAPYGFSVVSDSNGSASPDDGFYCDDDTLAHELGHNMGNAHDRDTAEGEDGVLDDPEDYGRYHYSFGHRTGEGQGNFYTIMTYGDTGQTSYRIFSNPDVIFCGGEACGIDNVVDNARSMRQTMPIIADFVPMVVPIGASGVRNDVDGKGMSEILWRGAVTEPGNFRWWRMEGASRMGTGSDTLSVPHTLEATGDFNGDGIVDLVWRKGEEDRILLWLGNGKGFDRNFVDSYGAGWDVVGAGDVNGDGKSDILWRRNVTASGNFRWWIMDGATRVSTGSDSLSVPHTFQTSGDFNGDGLLDVIFRNGEDDRILLWLGNGSGFDRNFVPSFGAGWTIVGAGDVTGDGKSDILWRRNVTAPGNFRWWRMDGATRMGTGSDTLSVPHTLQATGDFNGDGLLDLVWRKGDESRVLVWLGNGSKFDRNFVSSWGAGWSVVDPSK